MEPYRLPAQGRILGGVAWDDVRMQRWLDVTEDLVVDALRAGLGEHGIAERSHVVEKLPSRVPGQRVEIGGDRIG